MVVVDLSLWWLMMVLTMVKFLKLLLCLLFLIKLLVVSHVEYDLGGGVGVRVLELRARSTLFLCLALKARESGGHILVVSNVSSGVPSGRVCR